MARRLPAQLPNLVKGAGTVGAVSYQSQAARAFHDDEDEGGAVAAGGGVAHESVAHGHHEGGDHGPAMVSTGMGGIKQRLSPERGVISPKEVEEASRMIFARASPQAGRRQAPLPPQEDVDDEDDADDVAEEAEAVLPPPMFRGARRSGRGTTLFGARAAPPASSSLAAGNSSATNSGSSSSIRRRRNNATSSSSSSSSLAPRLHPTPEVHEEILRFGVALASNPRIQTAIREEIVQHHGAALMAAATATSAEYGGDEEDDEGVLAAEMQATVRRLCGLPPAAQDGDGESEEGEAYDGSFMSAGSFELVGALLGAGRDDSSDGESTEGRSMGSSRSSTRLPPGQSFVSVGRGLRMQGSVASVAAAEEVDLSDQVLDELLRGDGDEEDEAITQKLFATTPDDHVRRYLRNLDLECVICHEYMVEATAVDCGEGHTFCGECIERWLGPELKGRCPTCQGPVRACVPMRQYDGMIEKYVRASNLWDEMTSYYRRKLLVRMRREVAREEQEAAEAARRKRAGRASSAFMNAFAGLGSIFSRSNNGAGGRNRQGAAEAPGAGTNTAAASEGGPRGEAAQEGGGPGGAGGEAWWKSEVLQMALSVASMLIIAVLFRRVKVR